MGETNLQISSDDDDDDDDDWTTTTEADRGRWMRRAMGFRNS